MHVTVLMAVYNGVGTVKMAVESILKQTYQDWEFLIVDDASTDGTREILESMVRQDSRITIIRNPINLGLAASLNRGWRRTKGELIARMDADDASFPDRLERQAKFMETHPDITVLGGGAELVDEKGQFLGIAFRPENHDELVKKIYKENPFIHPTVMMRKNFLEVLGGYAENVGQAEDYDLWTRGYRKFHFHNLREPLIRYSVSQKQSFHRIVSSTLAVARATYRDGCLLTHGWYAIRFVTAAMLTKMGLYDSRLRPTAASKLRS
jgi:glycosyltransferase EpsE